MQESSGRRIGGTLGRHRMVGTDGRRRRADGSGGEEMRIEEGMSRAKDEVRETSLAQPGNLKGGLLYVHRAAKLWHGIELEPWRETKKYVGKPPPIITRDNHSP